MIAWLSGKVLQVSGYQVTLDVQGVGYELLASARLVERLELGASAQVVVYTDVREDSIRLFGFADHLEKQVFLLLLEVKGVGPRTSAEILSHIDKRDLLRVISSGNVAELQRVKGIGKKTAERIVVELKDKVGTLVVERNIPTLSSVDNERQPVDEAIEALQALGFMKRDAERAVDAALKQGSPLSKPQAGDIVREALRFV